MGEQKLNEYYSENSQGLAHRYRTLGYNQLDLMNRYGDSLLTPGELNSKQQKINLERIGILDHADDIPEGENVPAVTIKVLG